MCRPLSIKVFFFLLKNKQTMALPDLPTWIMSATGRAPPRGSAAVAVLQKKEKCWNRIN